MNIKYVVALSFEEKNELIALTFKGKCSARVLRRVNLLLLANDGKQDKEISELLNVSTSTIFRTKKKFVEDGLTAAINEGSRSGCPRKLDEVSDALLTMIACSKPPKGCARWTLSLIAQKFVVLHEDTKVSIETIRRQLKDNDLKPWQKKMWCIGKVNADYIARMEHVLALYSQPENPQEPVVNFDEAMKQMVADITPQTLGKSGKRARMDYEYKRVAVANIFMFYNCHSGWRKAKATESKKSVDFAHCMKDLVDIHYPDAKKIHVVMDNFGTHKEGSLYKAFKPAEALRILSRLEFHYTPKHASWLNKVEIEIGVMNR
jgi:transposase